MGIIGVTSGVMILSFYSVIAGWTLEYFIASLKGDIAGRSTDEFHTMFGDFTVGPDCMDSCFSSDKLLCYSARSSERS